MAGPIIVGTDGSDSAAKAVEEAIRLADGLGEQLHIVTAYQRQAVSGGLPSEVSANLTPGSNADAILADASSRARAAGVQVEVHAVTGDPVDALVETAEQIKADILVVGNKGLNSMKRFVLGSVPSKIIHHAPCTLHIVHTT